MVKRGKVLTVWRLVMVMSLIMVLTAAGCGSQPSANNGGGSNTAVKDPVKIGAIVPKSGVYASLGENILNGMKLYFDQIGWKAGGRDIKLLEEDEGADAQTGLRDARKLVEQDKVDMLTGIVNSSIALGVRDYVDQNKMPFLITNAGAEALTNAKKSDYIYRISFSNMQPNYSMGKYTYDNIAKKVFVIAPEYVAGHEQVGGFEKSFAAAGGQVIGHAWPTLGTNDYGAYLQQIAQAKPEAVYCFFSGSDAVNFVKQYTDFGLKKTIPLIGSGEANAEDLREAQGASVEGYIGALQWMATLTTPENKAFMDAFNKKYGKNPSAQAVYGYDAARIIADSLNTLKGDTSDKLKIVQAWSQEKFNSPRGPIEFDSNHNVVQNEYIAQTTMIDGKLQNKILSTMEKQSDPFSK